MVFSDKTKLVFYRLKILMTLALHVSDVTFDIFVLERFFNEKQWYFFGLSLASILFTQVYIVYTTTSSNVEKYRPADLPHESPVKGARRASGQAYFAYTLQKRSCATVVPAFLQLQIFVEAYKSFKDGQPTLTFAQVRLAEALFESMPQSLIQAYAIASGQLDPTFLPLMSITISLISVGFTRAMEDMFIRQLKRLEVKVTCVRGLGEREPLQPAAGHANEGSSNTRQRAAVSVFEALAKEDNANESLFSLMFICTLLWRIAEVISRVFFLAVAAAAFKEKALGICLLEVLFLWAVLHGPGWCQTRGKMVLTNRGYQGYLVKIPHLFFMYCERSRAWQNKKWLSLPTYYTLRVVELAAVSMVIFQYPELFLYPKEWPKSDLDSSGTQYSFFSRPLLSFACMTGGTMVLAVSLVQCLSWRKERRRKRPASNKGSKQSMQKSGEAAVEGKERGGGLQEEGKQQQEAEVETGGTAVEETGEVQGQCQLCRANVAVTEHGHIQQAIKASKLPMSSERVLCLSCVMIVDASLTRSQSMRSLEL